MAMIKPVYDEEFHQWQKGSDIAAIFLCKRKTGVIYTELSDQLL